MNSERPSAHRRTRLWERLCDLLFIAVLILAALLRSTGLDWGNFEHQHPDENFMTSVTAGIQAVESLSAYFDTATSTLNPANRGFGFYVYGNLPIILTRTVADWTGAANMREFGRQMSGLMDLGTIVMLYLIVARVYKRWVALLAAAFSALAVMQIQQSHFYTSDNFVTFFMFVALSFAVRIAARPWRGLPSPSQPVEGEALAEQGSRDHQRRLMAFLLRSPLLWLSLAFGVAYGMAMASKVNALYLALALPAALAVAYFRNDLDGDERPQTLAGFLSGTWFYLLLGGLAACLSFRIFQPYAFEGLLPSADWIRTIREQRLQVQGDLPWNLQWVRRSPLFSFQNLTTWGLGLPLGLLSWAGFLWMGWRIFRHREWAQHALLWGWTLFYFAWQSLQFNATMRYQLPVYPLLAMAAAWLLAHLWETGRRTTGHGPLFVRRLSFAVAVLAGVPVLTLTAAWAFAFTGTYTRTEPRIAASDWIYANAPGPLTLQFELPDATTARQPLPVPYGAALGPAAPYDLYFVARETGLLTGVTIAHAVDSAAAGVVSLDLSLAPASAPEQLLGRASLSADFTRRDHPLGESYPLIFDAPVPLVAGQTYLIRLQAGAGSLVLSGAALLNETDYDYPLPFSLGGYDPYGGIYPGNMMLQVYWPDNADKLTRLVTMLEQGDYILIPTNHQYGQITRVPERYPLTTYYYRELIGCPEERNIIECYRVAEPGMFEGRLGYDLVAVFENYPALGPWTINDQAAEEAFTFYDHPKVLIFQKSPDFDLEQVTASLSSVDYSHAVNLPPVQLEGYKPLLLSGDRLADQQSGGTWSDLFDRDGLLNRYPFLGLVVWYLTIFIAGLFAYPIVRIALPGLRDKGYPLARFAGLLIWAWFAWMAGSAGIPYSRTTITLAFLLLGGIGALLAYRQRDELKEEWRTRRKYFLTVEALFLLFFLIDLGIRLGNPDLWHPAKGGERPMNFSYFNAILKSTTFPPYDPWFAGGYINYYYYGYVIAATPVKMLGIVPSIAWNLLLPTLYAMVAMCAFSIGWNLGYRGEREGKGRWYSFLCEPQFIAGFAAAAAMVLLGNLGIVQMFYQAFQRLGAPGGIIADGDIFQRLSWAARGFVQTLRGAGLPIGRGDWYWNPSRVIPPGSGNEITEFPLFTFLYSDMHAHNWAMPVQLLAISWTLSVLKARARWGSIFDSIVCLLFGGLAIGALYPVNLSDIYTYLPLAFVSLAYTLWRYAAPSAIPWPKRLPDRWARLLLVLGSVLALTALSFLLYQPYRDWYAQVYDRVTLWKGTRTPISSYLTHWGVFLFVVVSWMAWETRQWMAETPLSALRKLKPFAGLILGSLLVLFLIMAFQQISVMLPSNYDPWRKISVIWLVLPLAAWAGVLLLRPGLPDVRRGVLFLVGTALALTVMVEVVAVSGDIGRMNTIFKFYLQAWMMLGLAAAAAFTWLLPEIGKWTLRWRTSWQVAAAALVTCSSLFLLLGGLDKIQDRMAPDAAHTLDSMAYMDEAEYFDYGATMDLSEDYRAIQWMQENIQGSPVIVEANVPEYRWGTRYTIYTGLPGVVGWNWHQRQQRAMVADQVQARVDQVYNFYTATDASLARAFLGRYNVRYIVVGQLERAAYAGDGIDKFEWFDGRLWREVYRDGQTVIYEVIQEDEDTP